MQVELWHIDGRSFHIGRHGLGQEKSSLVFSSDSLFAALTARLAELQGGEAVDRWIENFKSDPPAFVLSSAFPRAGKVCFFPRPQRLRRDAGKESLDTTKQVKKIKFVSEIVFRSLLQGENLSNLYQQHETLQGGALLLTAAEKKKLPAALANEEQPLWKEDRRPRVTIGRVDDRSTLYHTGCTHFSPGCGLWFAVRWYNKSAVLAEQLKTLFLELSHAGLGGERSSGYGRAEIEHNGSLELPDPEGSDWITLSRFLPHPQDSQALLSGQAAYQIEHVGGWAASTLVKSERRRAVHMLAEGSVLGAAQRNVPGQLVDVQPVYGGNQPLGHPVWRSGLALAVGIQLRKAGK